MGALRPPWRGSNPRDEHLATIATQILGGSIGDYKGITALINDLKGGSMTNELLQKVLRYVAPHWIPAEATGQLSALVRSLMKDDEGGAAALNGVHVARYTAAMYVEKVYPREFEYRVEPLTGGSAGRYVEDYSEQICEIFRRRRGSQDSDVQVTARLKRQDPWLFVVLPPPADNQTITALRKRFPRVVFLVWAGERLDELPDDLQAVHRLEPEVDLEREDSEFEDWDRAMSIIRPST